MSFFVVQSLLIFSTSIAKLHINERLYDSGTENKTYLMCQTSLKRRTCWSYVP